MSNRRRKNKGAPDGWLDYLPMKEVIEDIQIVPFKVPLPLSKFLNSIPMQYKWTPADVINRIPNLGLVIDLTFKNPCYYEPVEFLESGIDYIKIGCPGQVIPPEEIFLNFCNTIDNFRKEHPDLLAGVHCTHGVNRTGYMICRYMVERCGYVPENAIEVFEMKRGYRIERLNYTQKIQQSAA